MERSHRSVEETQEATYIIEIKKTPKGPAPWSIRRAWKGLELVAVEKPLGLPEFNPINGMPAPPRFGFMVEREHAIHVLRARGEIKAVKWFESHWPEDLDFSFGANEVNFSKF